MERSSAVNPWPFALLFFIGLMTLTRFSQDVRSAVGLSGGGFAMGVGVVGFIMAFRARGKS
jgi:hypothetical protein